MFCGILFFGGLQCPVISIVRARSPISRLACALSAVCGAQNSLKSVFIVSRITSINRLPLEALVLNGSTPYLTQVAASTFVWNLTIQRLIRIVKRLCSATRTWCCFNLFKHLSSIRSICLKVGDTPPDSDCNKRCLATRNWFCINQFEHLSSIRSICFEVFDTQSDLNQDKLLLWDKEDLLCEEVLIPHQSL